MLNGALVDTEDIVEMVNMVEHSEPGLLSESIIWEASSCMCAQIELRANSALNSSFTIVCDLQKILSLDISS
jgi:hypothetical protein